jgi:hypothetical protein
MVMYDGLDRMKGHDRRRRGGVVAVLAVALMSGGGATQCPTLVGEDCTEIGCSDGLLVTIGGAVAGPITVRVDAGVEQRTLTCQVAEQCLVFFDDWMPVDITIEASWGGGIQTVHAAPDYRVTRPNGPRCPPTCRQAAVKLALD